MEDKKEAKPAKPKNEPPRKSAYERAREHVREFPAAMAMAKKIS